MAVEWWKVKEQYPSGLRFGELGRKGKEYNLNLALKCETPQGSAAFTVFYSVQRPRGPCDF